MMKGNHSLHLRPHFRDRRIAVAGTEGGQVGRRGQPGAGGHSVHPRFLPLQERARAGFQLRPGYAKGSPIRGAAATPWSG